jgi:phosphonate transport system permease protein
VTAGGKELAWAGDTPRWIDLNPRKVEIRPTLLKRVQVTTGRILVFRYFWGWEDFWFDFRSPLNGLSVGELWSLAWSADRIDADRSNAALIVSEFWGNEGWQHGDVFKALLETVIMAFLGTVVAAFIGLPLAFLAAANFNRDPVSRFVVRRFFDFVRGIDYLIWSLIFIRAFGLGPLTGVMAIALTDTGTLGKLFSEAIENIDNKQVEGMQSTGASTVARYRFGVIPQILPVFISQSLYYLESNTRSATVIGALGAGGIGLKLVETLRTGKDWENTAYIIVLTLIVVIAMDMTSGWLRRKLTGAGRGD